MIGSTQQRNSFFAWPQVAVFEAARELWKLKSNAEKVFSSNNEPASYLTYSSRREKRARRAEQDVLTPPPQIPWLTARSVMPQNVFRTSWRDLYMLPRHC